MQHLQVKATDTTVTDQGVFTALAATYSVDRVNERIEPGAFKNTISAWKSQGRNVPVHWDHSGEAANVIGSADPSSMKEVKDGLYVKGQLDLETSDVARDAWRSMKNNSVALSFGYLVKASRTEDDVTVLTEIDLFEISIVPAPANPDTRFLSLKSAEVLTLTAEFKTVEEVQAFLDEKFPGHKISKPSQVSDLRKRSLDAVMAVRDR